MHGDVPTLRSEKSQQLMLPARSAQLALVEPCWEYNVIICIQSFFTHVDCHFMVYQTTRSDRIKVWDTRLRNSAGRPVLIYSCTVTER